MIRILIVEDDPMVAEFNKRYVSELNGFQVVEIVHNVADGIQSLKRKEIDLVLLDVYMPGANGMELLSYIREQKLPVDVILITAAADTEKIQTALRYGAVDYLIKPFDFDRFSQALLMYKDKHQFFSAEKIIKQEDLDSKLLASEMKQINDPVLSLPKGLTKSTLQSVITVIKDRENTAFSTDEIADETMISRVSIRKYLKYLVDLEILEESLTYGIGRPVYLYSYRKNKAKQLEAYFQ